MQKRLKILEVKDVHVGEHNVRESIDDAGIGELANSIGRLGVLVPLVVSSQGDSYIVIAGHRRLRAAKLAGLVQIPCFIEKASQHRTREISLAENLFRQDLTPVEEAAAIKDWYTSCEMDIGEIAAAMNHSPAWVQGRISILDWPDDVLSAMHAGRLSIAAGTNLAQIADDQYRTALVQMAIDNGATARTTAAWLQAWRAAMPLEAAKQAEPIEARPEAAAVVPYSPCVVCETQYRSEAIPFMPICPGCLNQIRGIKIAPGAGDQVPAGGGGE